MHPNQFLDGEFLFKNIPMLSSIQRALILFSFVNNIYYQMHSYPCICIRWKTYTPQNPLLTTDYRTYLCGRCRFFEVKVFRFHVKTIIIKRLFFKRQAGQWVDNDRTSHNYCCRCQYRFRKEELISHVYTIRELKLKVDKHIKNIGTLNSRTEQRRWRT